MIVACRQQVYSQSDGSGPIKAMADHLLLCLLPSILGAHPIPQAGQYHYQCRRRLLPIGTCARSGPVRRSSMAEGPLLK